MKKNRFIIVLLLLVLLAAGYFIYQSKSSLLDKSNQKASGGPPKIQVTASFYPLYFLASQIGGDKAEVVNITPAGAEPHDYEPTARDIAQIENNKLLILNGAGLETWGDNIKQIINLAGTRVVEAGQGLAAELTTESGRSVVDPHIWLSPILAEQMADKILTGFIEADPANKSYYQNNANILKTELAELDKTFRRELSGCAKKIIITSHAAFGYLAKAYNLAELPITGLSPDAEPSPRQLADIAKAAKDNNVNYIFFESLASPKLAETVAREIGAQTLELNPLEGLSDQAISQSNNYFSVMRSNLTNLKIALQCQP